MSKVKFIQGSETNQSLELIKRLSEVIFGTEESADFAEKFVPERGKVPAPKTGNFQKFLTVLPKCLWVVYDSDEEETVVGFVLISDLPHKNSMGVGINPSYSRKGLMTNALNQVLIEYKEIIEFPLNAYTSERNSGAIRLLEKTGFSLIGKSTFAGEPSWHYTIEKNHHININ